ncbi:MAG: hypothetical protein V1815_00655 [Candidatus Woesearchaeota archaeon]
MDKDLDYLIKSTIGWFKMYDHVIANENEDINYRVDSLFYEVGHFLNSGTAIGRRGIKILEKLIPQTDPKHRENYEKMLSEYKLKIGIKEGDQNGK